MTASLVWADDLTGAAEAANTWQVSASHEHVRILLGTPERIDPGAAQVWDLDLRHTSEADAQRAVMAALRRLEPDTRLYFKLDSQLRGPVRAYIGTLLQSGHPVVLSAANPALGRITTGGVHQVPRPGGPPVLLPLRSTFAGLPHHHLAATEHDRLPALLAAGTPALVTADVTSAADLDQLAQQVPLAPRTYLAGSAPFLGALATTAGSDDRSSCRWPPATPLPRLLAVLGTTEPAAHGQVRALRDRDPSTTLVTAPATAAPDLVSVAAGQVRAGFARSAHVVLSAAPPTSSAGHHSPEAMAALAATCATALTGVGPEVALYLSGGHTARTVLDRLDLTDLRVLPGPGEAVARLITGDGRTILTKPGSYGGPRTLLDLAAPAPAPDPPSPEKDPCSDLP